MGSVSDRFSGTHSPCNPFALAAYERAVWNLAAHRPLGADIDEALRLEPNMPAAIALRGFAHAMTGRVAGIAASSAAAAECRVALANRDGGTFFERMLSTALGFAAAGRLKRSAYELERHAARHPLDFLAIKLAHALRFMSGQPVEMLQLTTDVLPNWSRDMPGYGFILGCRAFALEETGTLDEAEEVGRQAFALEPQDVWALHAVAHVMEMAGRTREGSAWLRASRLQWGSCGAFGQHLRWHLALMQLAEGNADAALAQYDAGLQPDPNGDFRDLANAVSLLWRLEQEGVDAGDRWSALHAIAYERRLDCTYAFASLHNLLALIAAGDDAGATQCIDAMRARARGNREDQASVLARVGLPLAEALAGTYRRSESASLTEVAQHLPEIGGSRAQQDVFLRSLLSIAAARGDQQVLSAIGGLRRAQRADDRFQRAIDRIGRGTKTLAAMPGDGSLFAHAC